MITRKHLCPSAGTCFIAIGLLAAAPLQADPLDPTAFASLGASPFVSGTYDVDTSFDNPAPTIKQGTTLIATGLFYDPTPSDPGNRDEIAVFTFDSIQLPSGVAIVGLQNSNSRPMAFLSKTTVTIDGVINVSGENGELYNSHTDAAGNGGAAGPGGGGGGGGGVGLGNSTGLPVGTPGFGGSGLVRGTNGSDAGEDVPGDGGDGGGVGPSGGGKGGRPIQGGAGGAFGGNGGDAQLIRSYIPPGGKAYGDLAVTLEGGSGGGGGGGFGNSSSGGGGGGGALELGAVGPLSIGGRLQADGGSGPIGGGGAGGGILVHATQISLLPTSRLSAIGGLSSGSGGAGGGGRIRLVGEPIRADLAKAVNVAGGTSDPGGDGGVGDLTTVGTVEPWNNPPQLVCPSPTTFDCAPPSVTIQASISDPDSDQTLTLTLKEGATVLDTKSVHSPASSQLVTFNPVALSAGPHAVTVEVDDGTDTASCNTTITVNPDMSSPAPDLPILPTLAGVCSVSVTTVPTATDACVGQVFGITKDPLSYNTQGTFTIHWVYDDGHGNTTVQIQQAIVKDTIAPMFTSVAPNQNANATSPSGAVVNYPAAVAMDNCSPPTVSYSKTSGSLFSIGDPTVTVTAKDVAGNQATATFTVHVEGGTEQLSELIKYVAGLSIQEGTKISLLAELAVGKVALDLRKPQAQVASAALQVFINEASALKGKKLTVDQANRLISDAARIRGVIGG